MSDEQTKKINIFEKEVTEFKGILDIDKKKEEIAGLQLKMSQNSFWKNQKEANLSVERLKNLKYYVDTWSLLSEKINDLKDLLQIADNSYQKELIKEFKSLEKFLEKFRLQVLLSGKFDDSNAILEINSGAGGTEACDWAQILFRMYFRWAEIKGYKLTVFSEVRGDEAGFKNISFSISGKLAYGLLKSEKGVHRLVRISPFDSNKRRHTSFASVDVIPEVKDDITIDIKPEDLRIDTYRASGAGGQHINVTDSAVRITHISSGIVVSCQNERSQHQNKHLALKVLKARLYEKEEQTRKAELDKMSQQKRKIEWGSQIRSYVLCPYVLVKDHRTNFENYDAKSVLDGKIDGFIENYLKSNI